MLYMPVLRSVVRFVAPFALLTAALFASLSANAQTTYRWIDPASGRTVISDRHPPPGVKLIGSQAGEESKTTQIPYGTRKAAEKYPVVLYTGADCVHACKQARDLLNGRGVPFTEKVLSTRQEIAELAMKLGVNAMVPTIFVGQQHYKGFESGAWNNLLDLADYPKTAPYGAKPSGTAAK